MAWNSMYSLGGTLDSLAPVVQQAASTGVQNALSAPMAPMVGAIPIQYPSDDGGSFGFEGQHFSDMTPEELAASMNRQTVAKDAIGRGIFEMPETKEGWGIKAGLNVVGGLVPEVGTTFSKLARGVNYLSDMGSRTALSSATPVNRARTVTNLSPFAWENFAHEYGDNIGGYPTGQNALNANWSVYGDPTSAVGLTNNGVVHDESGGGEYGGMTDANNSAGNDYSGFGWA